MSVAPSDPPPRRLLRRLGALAASALLALVVVEVVLRAVGLAPHVPRAAIENEPQVHVPDAARGWRTVPGRYLTPPYVPGGSAAELTVLADGSRATAGLPRDAAREVLILGCSFAFGWAISDHETMAWQLQELLPGVRVVNRGVNAYGTYQALLLLEELLHAGERPERVVYAFHEVHEERNVAAPRWLRMLDENARRGNVDVPYATLDASGGLVRHPAERHPRWPLRAWLATVAYLERLHGEWTGSARGAQRRRVTQQLLLEMRDLCVRHGVAFEVVFLQAQPAVARRYARFLAANAIAFSDCVVPIPPEMRVPGEGHPNGAVNAQWAACLARRLA